MTVPPHPGFNLPYDNNYDEAAWKSAKTDGIRDKWHTDVSAALRAAEAAYNLIHWETVDLHTYEQNHGKQTLAELAQRKTAAQQHITNVIKPAIKALDKAKSAADTAAINPIISKASNTKAKAISVDMKRRGTMLKGITLTDYDQALTTRKALYEGNFKNFENKLSDVLSAARTFIKTVRANPTPQAFNKGLPDVARDITQQLSYVTLLQNNGFIVRQLNPDQVSQGLHHWANDDDADLPNNATRQDVLDELDRFETAVNAVFHWKA